MELWEVMQSFERRIGKIPKPKNAPRLIDLDLLFYGGEMIYSPTLIVPHPRWHERLFVIAPLADLVDTLPFPLPIRIPSHWNKLDGRISTWLNWALVTKWK